MRIIVHSGKENGVPTAQNTMIMINGKPCYNVRHFSFAVTDGEVVEWSISCGRGRK